MRIIFASRVTANQDLIHQRMSHFKEQHRQLQLDLDDNTDKTVSLLGEMTDMRPEMKQMERQREQYRK